MAKGSTMNATMADWLESRPPEIQELAAEFLPGSTLILGGGVVYVVGYSEPSSILVSFTNPALDYDAAYESRWPVCLNCAREGGNHCLERRARNGQPYDFSDFPDA